MKKDRKTKVSEFKTFFDNSVSLFSEISSNDKSNETFHKVYMLHIVPGGRNGGTDNRIVEVFYGSRPFDTLVVSQGFNVQRQLLSEYGATLQYQQHDNGCVTITMHPAGTKHQKQIENFISYCFLKNIQDLNKKNVLERHWKFFIAYMEVTSLDGNPTLIHRLRVWYMRFFKTMVIQNTFKPRKFKSLSYEIFKYVLTIGFSGFLIYIFTLYKSSTNDNGVVQELNKIKQKQETIITNFNKNKNIFIVFKDSVNKHLDKIESILKQNTNMQIKNEIFEIRKDFKLLDEKVKKMNSKIELSTKK